jgi:hypothetical protein
MKKTSIFTLLLCLFAALTMTSCMNDDDDNNSGLTPAEQHSAYQAVAGSHDGQLVYLDSIFSATSAKYDSVPSRANFDNDSTLYIDNFHVNSLAHFVADATAKACLDAAPALQLKCNTYFYQLSPVQFLIFPQTLSFTTVVDGTPHKITLAFYSGYPYSLGAKGSKNILCQIGCGGIYLDADGKTNPTNLLTSTRVAMFYFHN